MSLHHVYPSFCSWSTDSVCFDSENIYIAQLMLFNWVLMIGLYLLQINITTGFSIWSDDSETIWLAHFSYSQLFIIVSIDSISSIIMDKLLHTRNPNGENRAVCWLGGLMRTKKKMKYLWFVVILAVFVHFSFWLGQVRWRWNRLYRQWTVTTS